MFDHDPPWMPLWQAQAAEPHAARLGVSEVARSARGFLTAYKLVDGEPNFLGRDPHSKKMWPDVRRRFINRHVAQAKIGREPWWTEQGAPTRRHLALMMWGYTPTPRRTDSWARRVMGRAPR